MKLIHLRLTDYRGIKEQEVRFNPDGLTIVEGPNETGKTSLSEAVGLLFKYKDSSTSQDIKSIQPLDRDVGPKIELEAQAGPYHFTYSKRFLKQKETKLTLTRPKPDNYIGQEAHDRAERILDETIDLALWQALWIEQGKAVSQADLSRQTPLLQALDTAAGGAKAGAEEESLFERVGKEYNLYFSEKTGKERDYYTKAREARHTAQEEAADLERRIEEAEVETERVARLTEELGGLAERLAELEGDIKKYAGEVKEIERLESEREKAGLKLEKQRQLLERAQEGEGRRRESIEAVGKAAKDRRELEAEHTEAKKAREAAQERWRAAQETVKAAEERRREADAKSKLCLADRDYLQGELELQRLVERRERIERVRKEAALAAELLKKSGVNEDSLAAIEAAERELIGAHGRLEQGAPEVRLHALTDIDLTLDAEPTSLMKGEKRTVPVPDRLIASVPGIIEIEVKPGSGISDLTAEMEVARQGLENACRVADVGSLQEARAEYERIRDARRLVADKEKVEKENLRDLTYDQIESKIIALKEAVPAYLSGREPKPPMAESVDEAQELAAQATTTLQSVEKELEQARRQAEEARKCFDEARDRFTDIKTKVEICESELNRAEELLAGARAEEPDDELAKRVAELKEQAKAEEKSVGAVQERLDKLNPEAVKTLAQTAEESLQTVADQREAAETERTRLRERLRVRGEEGLQEQLNEAQIKLEHLSRDWVAMERRGAAATLLYETMKAKRDAARQAYMAPLKEQIERLSRLVFDHAVTVTLSDELAIVSRTSDGVTVPFDSLSGGTQEQLVLISRLACAMLVSKEHGSSLIFDDTLGYTDPQRLKSMGAVLATAARDCQVIILTCFPERFSHVGKAETVRLN